MTIKIAFPTTIIALLFLAACSPAASTPAPGAIETAIAQTQAAQPTALIAQIQPTATIAPPTSTPTKTFTPLPPTKTPTNTKVPTKTNTPGPSPTPRPSRTPRPTSTFTATPGPIEYSGSGDDFINVDASGCVCILHVVGNKGGSHFAVTSYETNGDYGDLHVNTTDPYDGYVLFGILDSNNATALEIKARGAWTITLYPAKVLRDVYTHTLKKGDVYSGKGDDVILVSSENLTTARITGNKRSRYFGVIVYGGDDFDVVVNTTESYEGTVRILSDTILIEVKAEDEWTVELK